jgi:type IV pilus assembly protein PilM
MGLLGGSRETFGLDIGSSAVKVVQLSEARGKGCSLRAHAIVRLPPQAITDGMIKDAPMVVDAIKEAVARAKVKATDAAIAVSGRELIVKKVELPKVSRKELAEAIKLEAEHHIPFAIDEVFLDYQVIGEGSNTMELLLTAVKKSKITDYIAVTEEAGFNPAVVDLDGFALENQHEFNHGTADTDAVALIDIGAAVMKTNVIRGGRSLFARDIPFGGNNYTQAIAQHLSLSFDKAEAAKTRQENGVKWDDLIPPLEAVSRELSLEVQRTFDYFASSAESERISKIVLSGGSSQLAGLDEFLSSTWGIPVEPARPFQSIQLPAATQQEVASAGPVLAVAVGLAMRRPGDNTP